MLAIVAVLVTIALTSYASYRDRVDIEKATTDIAAIGATISQAHLDSGLLPIDLGAIGFGGKLDPWGNPYQYVNHATAPKGAFRKDKNIVPINTDFDLSSMGKDGASVAPLTAAKSRDDIIRANNGAFIGLASAYDP